MTAETATRFTLKRLFFGDMLLNWFLGVVLVAFPAGVDALLGTAPLAPAAVFRIIGLVFAAFAAWQTVIILRGRLTPPALVFAALMAEIPVILLAVALLFMDLPLRTGWRAALWAGNVYMLALGAWYLTVARLLSRKTPDSAP